METEIREIIKKHMPEEVGHILKERLEQAENDRNTVKSQQEQILSKNTTIRELQNDISQYKKFDERNATLEVREKSVADKERKLEIDTLTYQLNAEKDKTKFSHDVALGLVRNTEYRKAVYDSESRGGYYDSQNRWIDPTSESKSHEETEVAK